MENPAGAAQNHESLAKSRETNKSNHGGVLSINTDIGRKHNLEAQRRNHNRVLAFHTEDAKKKAAESHTSESARKSYDTQLEKYGVVPMHSEETKKKIKESLRSDHARLSRIISYLLPRLNKLSSSDKLTVEDYKNSFYSYLAFSSNLKRLIRWRNGINTSDRLTNNYKLLINSVIDRYTESTSTTTT